MRVAIVWPRPREARWRLGSERPEEYPDQSDALLGLARHGIEPVIEESLSAPLNPLANMHEFYSGIDPLRALRVASRLRRYDAVICVGDATAFVLTAIRRLLRLRTPILLIDPALSPGYARRKRLQDYVIPRANRVVVFGKVQVEYLAKEYGSSVPVSFVYHRADTEFYRPAERPLAQSEPFVFSIGLDESRDFETLAKAAQICRDRLGLPHRFVLQTTRAVAEPGVLQVESKPVSYVRLREFYQQASVVALPLRDRLHAGGINTLLEAMSTGRAVVVSGSRGILDYVEDGVTARVVAPGDPEGMGRAIAELVASPEFAQRIGENARRFVLSHCATNAYASSLAAMIRDSANR